MKMMLCPICLDLKAIVSYKRDDPVLECGHVMTLELASKRSVMAESLVIAFNSLVTAKVNERKVSRDRAIEMVFDDIVDVTFEILLHTPQTH